MELGIFSIVGWHVSKRLVEQLVDQLVVLLLEMCYFEFRFREGGCTKSKNNHKKAAAVLASDKEA